VRSTSIAAPLVLALCATVPCNAAAQDHADAPRIERAVYGARGPELGSLVVRGSAGMALILPHFVLGARAGLGGGSYAELGYGDLAGFGQQARAQLGWGFAITDHVDIGVTARSTFSYLGLADGTVVGINFSSLPIGNDWEIGNDVVLSWHRPGSAHLTASVGPTFTLGGVRFVGFEQSELALDPSARSIDAAVQAEWSLWETANVFVRLDAQFLLGVEYDEACVQAGQDNCGSIVPFGFIPTGALGIAWAI
jgi:hypothetical protein